MKKNLFLCLLLCALMLVGCTPAQPEPATTVPETTVPETTAAPTTLPPHSELYIPGVAVEDVITWFNEVCLDAEFVDSGNPSVIQKWTQPVCFILYGDPTGEDFATLTSFTGWLNTIEGFPGISETTVDAEANLRIHFCDQEQMIDLLGGNFYGMDGGVTFWYNHENEIYNAIVCCRTDVDQHLRNSVILEEIYNGLGPVQDTSLREDSIIYSGFSDPQCLTEIDELILKLLYHPDIHCGMNAEECEAVIRQLYY